MLVAAKVSKAFSDKNRIKILKLLSEGESNVTSVADKLNVEENLASHHLRILADLGFLKNEKKGREVIYKINDTKFISLIRDLARSATFKDILVKALED